MTDKLSRCSVAPASTNQQEPFGLVKAEENLSCNDYSTVEFKIQSQASKINFKNYYPGLQEGRSCLVQGAAWQDTWNAAMKDNRAQKSWLIFKDNFIKAQEWSFLTLRKTSKYGRRPQDTDNATEYLEKERHCLSKEACRNESQSSAEAKTT